MNKKPATKPKQPNQPQFDDVLKRMLESPPKKHKPPVAPKKGN